MSQNRRTYTGAAYNNRIDKNNRRGQNYARANAAYEYGTVVPERQPAEVRRIEVLPNPGRRTQKRHSGLGNLLFMVVAVCATAFILVNYLQLQSELTVATKQIAKMETKINNLRESNDEDYNRILRSIDLEHIREVAICELGMTYAQEDQIVYYENAGNDYMRKVSGD